MLDGLPDQFVINKMTLNPVIPTGKFGIVFYLANTAPVATFSAQRNNTWNLAVISPLASEDAATEDLVDALDEVLEVLELEPTLQWEQATFEPFNERLWCYSVQVSLYTTWTPPEPEPVDFSAKTVAELRTYATDNDISLAGATRKADIISVLES
ncbi:Rho termination factor N-terminal domain-containing protein [Promicromonospora kroppenstedtii]|uniref:Rho termination factor N-terminal domain-containing protein n=1 Tax=Promicromonospora kroppenstedtii TaxID=440482 RepID=UPI00055EC1A8|nr:Rho termination factor N-terminal domain-containing protein [Promicromonospora kroppenstedtii]